MFWRRSRPSADRADTLLPDWQLGLSRQFNQIAKDLDSVDQKLLYYFLVNVHPFVLDTWFSKLFKCTMQVACHRAKIRFASAAIAAASRFRKETGGVSLAPQLVARSMLDYIQKVAICPLLVKINFLRQLLPEPEHRQRHHHQAA